jgi:hypothetical protein
VEVSQQALEDRIEGCLLRRSVPGAAPGCTPDSSGLFRLR